MGETTIQTEKSKLLAWGLQTTGAILLAIIAWFLRDAHTELRCIGERVQQSEGRHIRTETRLDGQEAMLKEIRDDVKRLVNRQP